jgi:hypothetical protein
VWPHPWLPNAYTVPFLDGRLVYAVLEGDETGWWSSYAISRK